MADMMAVEGLSHVTAALRQMYGVKTVIAKWLNLG